MRREKLVLGIEGGATKTDWIYFRHSGKKTKILGQGKLPYANLRLITDRALQTLFKELPRRPTHAGVFLAGCITDQDRLRLARVAKGIWPSANIAVGSDRDSSFAAAFRDRDGIVVLCGTGSAVTGRKNGKMEKAGGRGHILGDRGGGYVIALEGLRLVLETYDLTHRVSPLAASILRALALNRMEELVGWVQTADKMSVARLAPLMFECAKNGDSRMQAVIQTGAKTLAKYTASVARRLEWKQPVVQLLGGMFLRQPTYVQLYRSALRLILPRAKVRVCSSSGATGAAWLALKKERSLSMVFAAGPDSVETELADAHTEKANPRSLAMSRLSTLELVDLFIAEEDYVTKALHQNRKQIQKAVDLTTEALSKEGRLFYVGAGTSGRLGIMDASEIPPTFGASPDKIQGVIAGGFTALHSSIEGAEDQKEEGAITVLERRVRSTDVMCGISASGRTPFVLGALEKAKHIGARTILLTCNPARVRKKSWDLEIDLATGPELIAGSTRLKAGTATKLVLNMISSCTMIKLGKIHQNLMVHLVPSNSKLRDRAIRLVSLIKSCSPSDAYHRLAKAQWNVHRAIKAK